MINIFESLVLLNLPGFSRPIIRKVLDQKPSNTFLINESDYLDIIRSSSVNIISGVCKKDITLAMGKAMNIIKESEKQGIEMISYLSGTYPKSLKKLGDDAPIVLFFAGKTAINKSVRLFNRNNIGLIGQGTKASKNTIQETLIAVRKNNLKLVTSHDIADGARPLSDRDAINNSIIVMPCGLDMPMAQKYLKQLEMVNSNTILVSEYPIGVKHSKKSIDECNRIITAVSKAIIVLDIPIEENIKSAVSDAIKMNKRVFCIDTENHSNTNTGTKEVLIEKRQCVVITLDKLNENIKQLYESKFDSLISIEKFIDLLPTTQTVEYMINIEDESQESLMTIFDANNSRINFLNISLHNLEKAKNEWKRLWDLNESALYKQTMREFKKERNNLVSVNKEIDEYLENNKS